MMLLLMIAWWSLVTFTFFNFFQKKLYWQCWETYYCEYQIKKTEVVLSKVREFAFVVGWWWWWCCCWWFWPKLYLCICVFVFVYFDVRHLGTLFLRSSNNILFKNIAHDRSISKFYPNCICVFVYLCICICVFGYPRLLSDQLELFVTSPFSLTFSLGHSKWPKKCWKHFPIEQVLFYISPCNSCVCQYMKFYENKLKWNKKTKA